MINQKAGIPTANHGTRKGVTDNATTATSVETDHLTAPPLRAEVKQLTKEILSIREQRRKLPGVRPSTEFQPGLISVAAFGD